MPEEAGSAELHPNRRRSTRIVQSVPLTIIGVDAAGQPVQEHTAAFAVNWHGCRYFSKHPAKENTWVTLEIPPVPGSSERRRFRARVAWSRRSQRLKDVYQVGVEFEIPGNLWGILNPPEDWQQPDAAEVAEPTRLNKR